MANEPKEGLFTRQWVLIREEQIGESGIYWTHRRAYCEGWVTDAGHNFYLVRPEENLECWELIPADMGFLILDPNPPKAVPQYTEESKGKVLRMAPRACFECGSQKGLHDHHIVPKSSGGTATVPLCPPCHGKAHGLHLKKNHSDLIRKGMQRAKSRGIHIGKPTRVNEKLQNKVNELHKKGYSQVKIAKKLKITRGLVREALKKSGKAR